MAARRHVDASLVDVNPAAPPPRLGSSVCLLPLPDGGGWSVVVTGEDGGDTVLGRLPATEVGPLAAATAPASATVRSVRRADGALAALVIRVTDGGRPSAPADDSAVAPVPRRRGVCVRERRDGRAKKEKKN
jgi:hypothetical protein